MPSSHFAILAAFLKMTIPLHVILIHFPIVLLSLTSLTALFFLPLVLLTAHLGGLMVQVLEI